MAKSPPKTAAGKQRKVAKVMGEFKSGELSSSSGQTVSDPQQAVAIALSESGQARPKPARGSASTRLAARLSRRLDSRNK